ncbi:MAG TPA: hypothetical protein VFG21_02910 [Xanthomonadaceae bacterium]|nr:hypothetical protein [Xanthomonadaceae bacterium]
MNAPRALIAVAALLFASAAWGQLRPFHDYDIGTEVEVVTTVRVQANMIDDYLEGIKQTWVASGELAKSLGQMKGYAVYISEMPNSGDFNIVLVESFASGADLEPSKERYDAFMKAWGQANEDKTREIVKNYPAMREITGQYRLREITFK